MTANTEQSDALASRMKADIIALIDEGTTPPAVATFADLHEHIDANTLGGTEAMMERMEQGEFIGTFNAAVADVDAWLGRGRID